MTQNIHPVLGINRPDCEHPKRCSKCGNDIGEGEVPLMLFGPMEDNHQTMWVYCVPCGMKLLPRLVPTEKKP